MSLKQVSKIVFILIVLLSTLLLDAGTAILSLKEQAETRDQWLKLRLENVLPEIMRREKVDMWIVICREYNEDPVFFSLVPSHWYSARRITMLVFFDGGGKGFERLSVSPYHIGELYKGVWDPGKEDQWHCLAELVTRRNPNRIGINYGDTFAFGDGLSTSLEKKLFNILGQKYTSRVCSAEKIAVGWLERRTPQEIAVYPAVVAVTHEIVAQAFSSGIITPGVTTTTDVEWWIAEKINKLGLKAWFFPTVDFQRKRVGESSFSSSGVIQRGDLLHCDVGVTYLGLCSDIQEHAYVLYVGEDSIPAGLVKAMALGNRLQDILTNEFKVGRSGNQILLTALAKAREENLKASIYSHPLGVFGHGPGPTIGLWNEQAAIPGQGDYPLYFDTGYAIELNVKVRIPEWQDQEVRIALEQDALFTTGGGVVYLDGRQTEIHMVK